MAYSYPEEVLNRNRMIRTVLCITLCLLLFMATGGCRIIRNRPPVIKDGGEYGVTPGAFRCRYWNYYDRGLSYASGGFWELAETDFREALVKREGDQLRSRTYGLHFVEYFPRRELGVSLFHQEKYQESIRELEQSLVRETTARAQCYLDKARKAWIEQKGLDHAKPDIVCTFPGDNHPINRNVIRVKGLASDDTFVKEVRINGQAIPIDLSAPEIPFETLVGIRLGENTITIEAKDLTGKTSCLTRTVIGDRLGPVISISQPVALKTDPDTYSIKVYTGDNVCLKSVAVNGMALMEYPVTAVMFTSTVTLVGDEDKALITASDQAGNVTTAEVCIRNRLARNGMDRDTGRLLASLTVSPDMLKDDDASGAVHAQEAEVPEPAEDSGKRGGAVPSHTNTPLQGLSRNYALIVGIDAYEEWPPLKTAVNDAHALKAVLVERYGFDPQNIRLITDKDATRAVLIDALMDMTSTLGERDNFLLFFAGHGQLSNHANDGYWIPVEGKRGDAVWSWIAHSAVKNIIVSEEVRANNIVVIADSCYGGQLARGGAGNPDRLADKSLQDKLMDLCSRKSRQIITSGSLEPVADWGRDNHSLFAFYLIKGLRENTEPAIGLNSLINTYVWEPVFNISGQRPVVGRFKTPMDEDGEFVLLLTKGNTAPVEVLETPATHPVPPTEVQRGGDTGSPLIEIKTWEDHQTVFEDHILLEGQVSDDRGVQTVSINGMNILKWPGSTIHFNHLAELRPGDNPFVIESTDKAGHVSRKEVHFYRQIRKIHEDAARMSAALFPLEISGSLDMDIDSALFGSLFDCDRFSMKQWQANEKDREAVGDDTEMAGLAHDMGIDFFITGKAKVWDKALELRIRVIETETLDIVATSDVYDESVEREELNTLCCGLLYKIRHSLPIVEGKVAMIKGGKVIVNFGEEEGVRKGMHIMFFKEDAPVVDPDTGEVLGMDTQTMGNARISKVLDKMSQVELMGDAATLAHLQVGYSVITK